MTENETRMLGDTNLSIRAVRAEMESKRDCREGSDSLVGETDTLAKGLKQKSLAMHDRKGATPAQGK